jgi:N-hydroxyarylamine O-acetyltransferase
MELQAYLDRIGFEGAPRADIDTLRRLHRGHLNAIPYENLDVLLGQTLDFDIERIFNKLVMRRRGGWCYEMNGLLAWALETIGFRITRMAGAVHRTHLGDAAIGNHLVLLVHLEQDYVADVGFGDGLYEPTPLREGPISQHGFDSHLVTAADRYWRYHNHQNGSAPTFDFRAEAADPAVLEHLCRYLQTNERSPFTQNLVLQRRWPGRVEAIRNAFRITATPGGLERRLMTSADEMLDEMRSVFGIDVPEARTLWPLAEARGQIMLKEHPL